MPGQQPQGLGAVSLLISSTRARLVLSGDLDGATGTEMAEALEDAEHLGVPIEIDTRSVTFMDSAGIAQLARLVYRLPERRVRFIEPPELVRFLLDVTNIGAAVEIVEDDPGFPEDPPPPEAA